jgi:parvulin-like peptidyl-prolyl isomerase
MDSKLYYRCMFISALIILPVLSGCGKKNTLTPVVSPPESSATISSTVSLEPTLATTATLPESTVTPEPRAAEVNGEGITLAEFQAELARYQTALKTSGESLPAEADQKKVVLDEMINQRLLAQSARQAGYKLSDVDLQARIDQLASTAGGSAGLVDWETKNGYDDASFRQSLRLSAEAAWQRDKIVASVPTTAEQVHVRQIIVYSQNDADKVITRLKSGVEFATLAWGYDLLTGGDLGWFPKGYLPIPEVEASAFSLQIGEYSQIIKSKAGYHIIQVIERDAQRPLSTDALRALQRQALENWIIDQHTKGQITTLIP